MRGMYGLDVLEQLRQLNPDVRVIVISADIQTSSRDLVREGGASAFLTKPVEAGQLLDTLAQVLAGEPQRWN